MWHLWYYQLPRGRWRKRKIFVLGKRKHTHTHRGGSNRPYLVISDVLVLSCFYLLTFICICCSLISVKHFLTNLFDKSTLGINQARRAEENKGRGEGRINRRTADKRRESPVRTEGGGINKMNRRGWRGQRGGRQRRQQEQQVKDVTGLLPPLNVIWPEAEIL